MQISECSHIRIRDGNDYRMNVERMIKHLEARYNIDFRSLPQWESLVHRMHLSITDCKRQIQDSKRRKASIINKLYVECCRPSPFELTDDLARTAKKWQIMKEQRIKIKKTSFDSLLGVSTPSNKYEGFEEALDEATLGHQNTEIVESLDNVDEKLESRVSDVEPSHLPNFICINQHKLISPVRSTDESLKPIPSAKSIVFMSSAVKSKEWLLLNNTLRIISHPKVITIEDTSLEEQVLKFALLNCSTEYLNLRYMEVTEKEHFKRAKIVPVTPLRLYPGLAVTFKFVFKLIQSQEEFTSQLYFRIGQKVLAEAPLEAFCLPIASKFIRPTSVTDVVTIPSMYYWRINAKNGFPSSKMSVLADRPYNVHIRKLVLDLANDFDDSKNSIDVISPATESILLREEDEDIVTQSKAIITTYEIEEHISIKAEDIIDLIIEDIIQLALDVFLFEKTFLKLQPFSKQSIKIYHTKFEYIGLHQRVYELVFNDPETSETAFCKTVKVYGEALPNPIQVQPYILDMNESPVTHGYCEDHFTIINNQKILPVTIKIKLTTKIKKLIRITPMEMFIPAGSRFNFTVRTCSKDLSAGPREDLVYLTFKIIVIGDKSIYRSLPPIFYEVIVPCSFEFKKLYNKKFFDEFPEPSLEEIEVVMPPVEPLPKSPKTPRATAESHAVMNQPV